MILYQLAMDMERREMLYRSIREEPGDPSHLIEEKAWLEQAVLLQTLKWKEVGQSDIINEGRFQTQE